MDRNTGRGARGCSGSSISSDVLYFILVCKTTEMHVQVVLVDFL